MKPTTFVMALTLVWGMSMARTAGAQSCHTGTRPANPAPVSQVFVTRIAGDFSLNEEDTREIKVEAGKSYWLSAAGCPRMGRIQVAVTDANGKTVQSDDGYSPSACFSPTTSGKYTVKVTAKSLTGSNPWGSIDAAVAESNCGKNGK